MLATRPFGPHGQGAYKLVCGVRGAEGYLVSLKDGIDLAATAGRRIAHILARVAQYKTEVRAERVLAGRSVARAAGKRCGGSKPGRRLVVTSEQVVTIRRMNAEGESKAVISAVAVSGRR